MNNKKTAAFIAALCISLIFASCSKDSVQPDSEITNGTGSALTSEYSIVSDSEQYNSIQAPLPDNVIMSIGGHNVSEDEYKYYFAYAKYSIDGGDENYWKDDENGLKINDLKKQTYDYLYSLYTIYSLADKENITLDNKDYEIIDSELSSARNYYNASNVQQNITFDDYLKNTCCTEEVYRETLVRSRLEKKVISKLFEEDFRKNNFKDYIRVKYINVLPEIKFSTDENGVKSETPDVFYQINPLLEYTDEEKSCIEKLNKLSSEGNTEELKSEIPSLMNIIKERLDEGESFDKLIKKYNMDIEMPQNEDGTYQGYYIKKGHISEQFSNVAFSLSEDQTSDITETAENGWFIIKRESYDEYYLKNYLINIYMGDPSYGYTDKYAEIYSEIQKNMESRYCDFYDDITYEFASINYEL